MTNEYISGPGYRMAFTNPEAGPDHFETIVCASCLYRLDEAGQLDSSHECERESSRQCCEQCNGYLVDGEIFSAVVML